ncbi:MAG: ABC transporter substrate-binding protein [Burkholderiales bacterium]|jgi:2'-hydroxybiphenyl-2-sulfinate desulfinase|nr:ABC transporter substrate-binding protein [Microcystis sp. M020S1]MCA3176562.1 ABC transporter substrate-binding protein [Burkholderiales bacterium]
MTQSNSTLWYARSPVPTPLGIALRLGWLETSYCALGLEIKSALSTGVTSKEALFDHRVINSIRQGGSIPALHARASGKKMKILGLTWTDEFQAIIALPHSGIKDISDLVGRRVGIYAQANSKGQFSPHVAVALRGITNTLSIAKLGLEHIEITSLYKEGGKDTPYQVEARALTEKKVDAIFVKGAQGAELMFSLGAEPLMDIGSHPDKRLRSNNATPRTLTVDTHLLEQQPYVIHHLLDLMERTADWAEENPGEAYKLIAQEVGTTVDWVKFAYPKAYKQLRLGLFEDELEHLQNFSDFLYEQDFIPRPVNVMASVDHKPLNSFRYQGLQRIY